MTKNEFIQKVCISLAPQAIAAKMTRIESVEFDYKSQNIIDDAFLLAQKLEERAKEEGLEFFFDVDTPNTMIGDGRDLSKEPISVVIHEVDRLDEEEASERRKHWPQAQKVGYARRADNCCKACEIKTVSELVFMGFSSFCKMRNMGKSCADVVKQALENLYGIKAW